ncbi:APC family permease [Stenomitos frigidus]|uniref:Amino acid permease n=1 Tax=Stenomitos frigidus ULC18 TaxID=2107698 RepID=A0A2T1DST0_9CYAN|nr:APC family permease [Stenomitos frigidus]PSB23542.1 amino acid permease [Stenomitos frigidus ULC18]
MTTYSKQRALGLRADCLSFPETMAQSVGNIAPAAMPAVSIGLVFASAGNGTWLTFLIATIGLALVSININHFARRLSLPGTIYGAIGKNLGPTAGIVAGWAMVAAYLCTAIAVMSGFVIYANVVLNEFGLQAPPILLYTICILIVWFYAFTDIQLSTVLMLLLELTSILLILSLAIIVLAQHGFAIDTPQVLLKDVSPEGLRLGLVLAIFSYVGFESATTLGDEVKRPFQNIPRAVLWSAVLSGLFFILVSYAEVLGFRKYAIAFDKTDVPLSVLSNLAGVELLGLAIAVGVMFSFLTCCLASITAGTRVLYSLGRQQILPKSLGTVHPQNQTPHVAIFLSVIVVFLIPTALTLLGISSLDIYGYFGTLATYGFLLIYVLISIAGPIELYRQKRLRQRDLAISVPAVLFMMTPAVASFFPIPPFPYNFLPYGFLAYLMIGAWLSSRLQRRSPQIIKDMERDFEVSPNSGS